MDDKSRDLKTNEQIIEELMKNLKSTSMRADDDAASSNDVVGDSIPKNGDNADRCEMEGKGDTNLPNDEDTLKDKELTLSEDEKEVCGII